MPEKLSSDQRHERSWCAFTHLRVAIAFLAFCVLELFLSWKELDKPFLRVSAFELPFYLLVLVVFAPMYMIVFRCFSERFVIGITTVHIAMPVIVWLVPTPFNPSSGLVGRAFLGLWVLALLMSLGMTVQSVRNPYIGLHNGDSAQAKRRLPMLIVYAIIVGALILGAFTYFLPLR